MVRRDLRSAHVSLEEPDAEDHPVTVRGSVAETVLELLRRLGT